MKNLLAIMGLFFVLNVFALEEKSTGYTHPSNGEIAKNRACFADLEIQGCGKLEEDQEQFRSCMSNALVTLDDYCKKLMLELYGSN